MDLVPQLQSRLLKPAFLCVLFSKDQEAACVGNFYNTSFNEPKESFPLPGHVAQDFLIFQAIPEFFRSA